MAESEARDWVLFWVEDLHQRAGSKQFWEEEQERRDKIAYFLLVGANLPPRIIPSLLLLIQPLDFIFYKILPALNIMITVDSLFLPKAAHLFIYLLLKPLLSKLLTPLSADKKNSCTA